MSESETLRAAPEESDYLVRGMGLEGKVRALAVRSTEACNELMKRHGSMPTAAAAVSRVANSLLLLGGTIKGREQVSIEVRGDGPLAGLYGVADAHGSVRVTVDQPHVTVPPKADGSPDVATAIGMGALMVTKNLGMKEPYRGVVPLVSGEIAQDMVEYFLSSEQRPSAMALGEHVEVDRILSSGGWLIQVFPDADETALERLETQVAGMRPMSELIRKGVTPDDVLRELLPDFVPLERYPVQFQCSCSAERYERVLITLGEAELQAMIDEDGGAELRCHYCNEIYAFTRENLEQLVLLAKVSGD